MTSDSLIILYAYLVTAILQLAVAPFLIKLTKTHLYDQGWAFGRLAGWLVLGLFIWLAAFLHIPANTQGIVIALQIILIIAGLSFWVRHLKQCKEFFIHKWPLVITYEILFALGFFGLSIIRMYNPQILDLEKFMDAGFMAAYMRSPTLPAHDMWLSGHTINYYTFGHFLGSVMVRIWSLNLAYSYNLLLGLILGLVMSQSASVIVNLLSITYPQKNKKTHIIAGIIGSFLVAVGGNTHTLWYWLKNRSFSGYWYADATRFIDRTIHEFPSYSFVVSDLHAHVWDLPVVLASLLVILIWYRSLLKSPHHRQYLYISGVLGVMFGIMTMTSTWDTMTVGLFLGLLGLVTVFIYPHYFLPFLKSALIVAVVFFLTTITWWLSFDSIAEGVARVTERSPLWQLAVLWSGHVVFSLIALCILLKKLPQKPIRPPAAKLFLITLILSAWALIVLPEIIYFKDIYTGHPRANTMFKLTYQAFVLMSLTAGWGIGALLDLKRRWWLPKVIFSTAYLIIIMGVSLFPYFAYPGYYGHFDQFKGLNGLSWLKEQHPDDYQGILWLNANVAKAPVIVEAVGESYTTFARVSAFTGLPTVLGWRVHEWLWRGGFDIPGQRTPEVETIYNKPQTPEAKSALDQYHVSFIFIGDKEFEAYPALDLEGLLSLGEVVFNQNRTYIIKLYDENR